MPHEETARQTGMDAATVERLWLETASAFKPPPDVSRVANDFDQRDLPDRFVTRDGNDVLLQVVPAADVIDTWTALVGEAESSGRWPVILSTRRYFDGIGRLMAGAADGDLDPAAALIEEAATVDPRRFFDERWEADAGYHQENLTDGPLSEQAPARKLAPITAQLIPDSGTALIGLFECRDSD